MKIGVFGGSFDPPHLGHLGFAKHAADQLELDEVIFVPCSRNPLKSEGPLASSKDRLAMLATLLGSDPRFALSDIEVSRKGPSYTIDTIQELQSIKPGDYWLLLGVDAARELSRWKQPDKLLRLSKIALALRPPTTSVDILSRFPLDTRDRIDLVTMKPNIASSSSIRSLIQAGRDVSLDLPRSITEYIRVHHLYKSK